VPQLGIAELDAERRLVIADIPGLIEGAHEGAGLGLDFLRHIERTRVLVHMVDVLPLDGSSPIESYRQIRAELEAYSPKLAAKPEILAANKMDLSGASEALADLRQALPGKQIYAISAVSGTGLRPLLEALWQQVKVAPESMPLVVDRPYVPPAVTKKRDEKEMFTYVETEAAADDWEPVDGDDTTALEPIDDSVKDTIGFINAGGEKVASPKPRKKAEKVKRTLIEPVHVGRKSRGRKPARVRKMEHDAKVKLRKAMDNTSEPEAPEVEVDPAPTADPALAAEIAAIKADDARKSKYYNRRKTDV
jgi:hypothetical protein